MLFRSLVANGEIISVDGTPLDFRAPKEIGKDIKTEHRDIDLGFDHTYVFSEVVPNKTTLRAMVKHQESGRTLKVYTDQPCMQLYTGNFLEDVAPLLKGGVKAKIHTALCLETQKMPNSINHAHFTDVRLDKGEKYIHNTVYEFGVE